MHEILHDYSRMVLRIFYVSVHYLTAFLTLTYSSPAAPTVVMTWARTNAMTVNKCLQAVLLDLFPGYNGGR